MRKTKIVCTIGPASRDENKLREMMLAGMNVCRLNFSHGTHAEHKELADRIKKLREELSLPVALLLDTKGPEIRTGALENGPVQLVAGETVVLTTEQIIGNTKRVSVSFDKLPQHMKPGGVILLDDGLIELSVQSTTNTDVECTIVNSGMLGEHKGINLPGTHIDMAYLSVRDCEDIMFAVDNDFDFIALSFVRSAQDVRDVRNFIDRRSPSNIELIAKIENREGVDNIKEIIHCSNGIMVARGDMGVEIPFEELPHVQKAIIRACYTAGKKVITATQMLESMISKPRPTRAEITDVANAIYDGTSAIMLSGETANGKYPLEALKTMAKIAVETEANINYATAMTLLKPELASNVTNAISHATCTTAQDLGASAIVAVTRSGRSARMISRFRPASDIAAVTPSPKTYYQLALSWGVTPIMNEFRETSIELFNDAVKMVVEFGLAQKGDLVVITGSSQIGLGSANTLQVHLIGDILIKGDGNRLGQISGRVCVVDDGEIQFIPGDILVISRTTNEILHLCRQASGIVTEELSDESGAAAAGLALDIPVVANADSATRILKTGAYVRIDGTRGYVYNDDGKM